MALNSFGKIYSLAFEVSPILLVGGIATNIPGGVLPIAVLTEGISIAGGLLHGNIGIEPSARFIPQAGTTLIQQDVANLNFYNQIAAANAVVNKPNRVLMQMLRPASTVNGGYANKGITFSALKMTLDMHNQSGGSYIVLTPSFIYTSCLMKSMVDNSGFSGQNKQVQYSWLLEFEQPLLSISQLEAKLGSIMDRFDSGTSAPNGLSWSGVKQQFAQEY
jgi:hypothetical protein